MAGITGTFALDEAILNGEIHGVALDSTWRNISNTECPLTLLTSLNAAHRMVPSMFEYSFRCEWT